MVSSLEERVAKIEGILEQMDRRLNHLESEVRDLRSELYREIRDLRKALDYRRFKEGFRLQVLLVTWSSDLNVGNGNTDNNA
jgi:chromosome segregation ATPase